MFVILFVISCGCLFHMQTVGKGGKKAGEDLNWRNESVESRLEHSLVKVIITQGFQQHISLPF